MGKIIFNDVEYTGGSALPDGGAKGDILAKKSGADGDAEWVVPPASIDAYTKTETDALLDDKADKSDTYTKTEVDALIPDVSDFVTQQDLTDGLDLKADKATTYTKSEVDSLIPDVTDFVTETEMETALAAKADADSVYTKTEADTILEDKADKADTYTKTEVDALVPDVSDFATKTELSEGLADKADSETVPFIANYGQTTYSDVTAAIDADRAIVVNFSNNKNLICVTYATYTAGQNVTMSGIYKADSDVSLVTITLNPANTWSIAHTAMQKALESGVSIKTLNGESLLGSGDIDITVDQAYDATSTNAQSGKAVAEAIPSQATENTTGTIKLNPEKSVTLNEQGQLEVGGRIGQFSETTGLFAPNDREPLWVGNYSLLMTDAKGVNMEANRAMAVVSGLGLACKSAAAGTTEYRVNNTYANRIQAKMCEGGYIARDEATSTQKKIVKVLSVTINGSAFTPDSSADGGEIVIKTAETLNPDAAITNIRLFGVMKSYATLHVGNGVASLGGGRNLLLGGGVTKAGNSNDNCLVGNAIYSSGNGNACFGRQHIAAKNRGFLAGSGHDSTNAPSEGASAVGVYSLMSSNTLFAVGNGTSATNRSNAFEVTADGGIVLKSQNGTRYKLTVADDGTLSTTAV